MIVDYGLVRVRPACLEDAAALAPKLRVADRQEIDARSGRPPEEVLRDGVSRGRSFALELSSGEVGALFGVGPTEEPRLGCVWLLGSDALLSIKTTFLRHSREWVDELSKGYDLLGNHVDARNTVHINWLRWLGFRFLSRAPIGRHGELFYEFVRLTQPGDSVPNV